MVNISVSTNVDLGNCLERIGVIAKEMHPEGIEIFSLPGNYSNTLQLELPQTYAGPEPNQPNANCVEQLNAEYAVKIGKELNKNGIKKIQFHYPWQKDLLDMDGHHLAQTFNFCDLINDEAKADKFTINYHNVFKYPSPRTVNGLDGAARENMIKGLEAKAVNSQYIKKDTGSKIKLIAENNPATSWDDDKKTGQMLLDNVDIVAEDYCDRKGLDGFNLDIPHAESVVKASNANEKNSNIAWMIRQYGGVPKSAQSMENFVSILAPKIEWLHIGDEPDAYSHAGLHIGDGKFELVEDLALLKKYLKNDVVATIEVKDGHKPEGFSKIIKSDYPKLQEMLKSI